MIMKSVTLLTTLLIASFAAKANKYDTSVSLTANVQEFRSTSKRAERPCIVIGLAELEQLIDINVTLDGCRIVSEGEPEFSLILESLYLNSVRNVNPISPIPSYNIIAEFMDDIIGKSKGRLTILASPQTQHLANTISSIIQANTSLTIDVQIPQKMQDLPKVFKRIDGDAVLMLHDPKIFRNPKQVRSFMELMIARGTPVVGVSPYFKELGGLIEISKPLQRTYQEATDNKVNSGTGYLVEYWETIPKIFGLEKNLKGWRS
ncbi:exported hypothetical protein [Vibrio nigripulchritudo FTn2]|uniref:hypothetical protein n=1 Tax=Vibrio nigripulchritudo TaxID=28173 RepID=UPI0003B1AE06|nr:hypothetical protein [Vibrio nigripulchritudo]CCN40026.1 exported hypothetical protein [Vibrio nigripulchritudo FTn2]